MFLDSELLFKSSNLVFSNIKTSPGIISLILPSKTLPFVSGTKITGRFNNLLNSTDTTFKDFVDLSWFVLILPKWDSRITFAPDSIAYKIVGIAAWIRLLEVITPFLIGTLKSTLINTFLPFNSKSFIVFFIVIFLFYYINELYN